MTSRNIARSDPSQTKSISTMTDVTFCHMQPGLLAPRPIEATVRERSGERQANLANSCGHLAKCDQRD